MSSFLSDENVIIQKKKMKTNFYRVVGRHAGRRETDLFVLLTAARRGVASYSPGGGARAGGRGWAAAGRCPGRAAGAAGAAGGGGGRAGGAASRCAAPPAAPGAC